MTPPALRATSPASLGRNKLESRPRPHAGKNRRPDDLLHGQDAAACFYCRTVRPEVLEVHEHDPALAVERYGKSCQGRQEGSPSASKVHRLPKIFLANPSARSDRRRSSASPGGPSTPIVRLICRSPTRRPM